MTADCFSKVTYKLHESFGDRAKQGTFVLPEPGSTCEERR
jgi:transcription initiation factor IIF auxiliary subunit